FIKDDPPKRLSIEDAPVSSDSGTTVPASADPPSSEATTTAPTQSSAAGASRTAAASNSGTDGTYTLTPESVVGYRVVEVLFGQDTEGVGRTNSVTGSLTIAG